MKKSKIIALSSALALTSAAVFAATSMASAAPALGDVNNDGRITATDARTILRHAAKLETIDDSILPAADVNGDGKVTVADARLVLRYSAKLISEMGGESKYNELTKTTTASDDDNTTTTKKNPSEFSTKPVTKPTTKPTDPTTSPATDPTDAPTTEPATEEPTTKKYNDNIPADIHSFTEGKFDFVGTIISGGGKQSVRFSNDGERRMRISMSSDGLNLDLLKLTEKNLLKKDVAKYYIVNDEKKAYTELDKTAMLLLGMKEEDLSFTFATIDISNADYTTSQTTFNGKENVTKYVFSSEDATLNFYMDGDTLIGMESCDADGNIQQMIIFDSFSGDVPASRWSLDGYSKKSLLELAGTLSK